ncbi:hypothetical protein [Pedobacter sp. ASV12]|uniref:hypothetical protein n=1 Tax=Pedobacter sp. ASV12 TaxID=2795120 RepID=UPI0018ED790A|nr:hypothetical protein [Pedobacter sp. ASV12]
MELEEQTYRLLDLSYVREIAKGDVAYERNVARLFVDIIPENLASLERDMAMGHYAKVKTTLHHMQSSISIMGFYPKLEKYMEPTVYTDLPIALFRTHVHIIIAICREALVEAQHYLHSLD